MITSHFFHPKPKDVFKANAFRHSRPHESSYCLNVTHNYNGVISIHASKEQLVELANAISEAVAALETEVVVEEADYHATADMASSTL